MRVLIVEGNPELAAIWQGHLERAGASVELAASAAAAVTALDGDAPDILVLNLDLEEAALSVADYARFRAPDAKVICVTGSSFFSDGSVFTHCTNACACLPAQSPPEDLAALVEYHGRSA